MQSLQLFGTHFDKFTCPKMKKIDMWLFTNYFISFIPYGIPLPYLFCCPL